MNKLRGIVFTIMIIIVAFVLSCCANTREKHQELQTAHEHLRDEVNRLGEYSFPRAAEDAVVTLRRYFKQDGTTFEEARDAFDELNQYYAGVNNQIYALLRMERELTK